MFPAQRAKYLTRGQSREVPDVSYSDSSTTHLSCCLLLPITDHHQTPNGSKNNQVSVGCTSGDDAYYINDIELFLQKLWENQHETVHIQQYVQTVAQERETVSDYNPERQHEDSILVWGPSPEFPISTAEAGTTTIRHVHNAQMYEM